MYTQTCMHTHMHAYKHHKYKMLIKVPRDTISKAIVVAQSNNNLFCVCVESR